MSEPYDYQAKKIVIVLASSVSADQAVNIVGHLALALGHGGGEGLMGRAELVDGSGVVHRGIARYPVIVTTVKPARLRRLIEEARGVPGLYLADYPAQMLTTGHDDELAAEIGAAREDTIQYLGALLYGELSTVGALTGKFMLWGKDRPGNAESKTP